MSQLLPKIMFVINRPILATNRCFMNKSGIQSIGRLVQRLFSTTLFISQPIIKNLVSYKIATDKLLGKQVFFSSVPEDIDSPHFENVCAETLDSLCEWFDELIENTPELKNADVMFGDGVLTVNLGAHGTYVINRQSPNKQIWLSSPTSGPKRYDFVADRKGWVYRHDNKTLHQLLQTEISVIVKSPVNLSSCAYFSV